MTTDNSDLNFDDKRRKYYQLLSYISLKVKYLYYDSIRKHTKNSSREILASEDSNLDEFFKFSNHSNQEENLDKLFENELLVNAIHVLPFLQQKFIVLHYQIGYSQKEIAEILNISPSAVCQLNKRALQNIKKDLELNNYGR